MTLPFYNDFSEITDGLVLYDTFWDIRDNMLENNLPEKSAINDYYTYVETDWFSIPSDAPNATVYFDYKAFKGPNHYFYPHEQYHIVVEATTDRVHWHKLAALTKSTNLAHEEVSLNEFVGEPYVQVRIMFEALINTINQWRWNYDKPNEQPVIYIDNFTIDFSGLDVPEVNYTTFNTLEISPNPASTFVKIKTDLNEAYNVSVYNMMGIKVLEKSEFKDGNIDISTLPSGIYFIKVSNGEKAIAKRIVIS